MSESDTPPNQGSPDADEERPLRLEERSRRVLVVDDDEELLAYIDEVLRLAGYAVTLAKNGREALEQMAREVPDVILLDVMMPELSGDEVLDLFSTLEGQHPPVVLMTAAGRARDRALAHRNPFYLPKPFDPSLLLATIETALEQTLGPDDEEGSGEEGEEPTRS